jgi:cysteine desulfurase
MKAVYLDHSATTPIREEVMGVMLPYFAELFGNASSIHSLGQRSRKDLEEARSRLAHILGAHPKEVIFTSGGTESDNLAIKGVAYANREKGNHIVTSSIEHSAVLTCCQYLEKQGFEVTYLPVDRHGLVGPDSVREALKPETVLVSVMLANSEVGTLQPIKEIGTITKEKGIPFHTDAVQAVGKVPIRADDLNVDLLSLSGHKIYGPKGIGALYFRRGVSIVPLIYGGHHELGYRPGTENVAAIVGLAKAMELAEEEREDFSKRMYMLRTMLERGISVNIEDVQFNGHPEKRLPNILNASFKYVDGESLLLSLDMSGIAVSTGSACSAGSDEASHVLTAMGIPPDVARGSLRFSLGRLNDEADMSYVLGILSEVVAKLREVSPLYHHRDEERI